MPCWSPSETEMSTPLRARMSTSSGSLGRTTEARRPSEAVSCRAVPSLLNRTRSTLPFSTAWTNSEYRQELPSGSLAAAPGSAATAGALTAGAATASAWAAGVGVAASACWTTAGGAAG